MIKEKRHTSTWLVIRLASQLYYFHVFFYKIDKFYVIVIQTITYILEMVEHSDLVGIIKDDDLYHIHDKIKATRGQPDYWYVLRANYIIYHAFFTHELDGKYPFWFVRHLICHINIYIFTAK
jgi:hypothetical protein